MTEIHNDTEFRQKIESLDSSRQRILAARFVEDVLPFCNDERVSRIVKIAANPHASADELPRRCAPRKQPLSTVMHVAAQNATGRTRPVTSWRVPRPRLSTARMPVR